ncbi:amidase signature domain-containing protein [Aspergillus carlsbadensis]|nr:amidase signature domain-containing protein [Aspergillus carlsbadensis]
MRTLSIVEATIAEHASALSQGHTNSVELATKHLLRIAKYDQRSILLNSTPITNEHAFETDQASDQRRASGQSLGRLDRIPCTIKDSYKIQGMTVAFSSPVFKNLVANEDAFKVKRIKEAGAVILGRTNMPPMAARGMQRGVYGRAESPYNGKYLTASFASGTSNGLVTATAARFGVFDIGEEAISSGRSPASNNGVLPMTRRKRVYLARTALCPAPGGRYRQTKDIDALSEANALAGKNIGVPKMYIGGVDSDPTTRKVHSQQPVIDLRTNTHMIIKGLGATVEEVDFPVVTKAPPHRNKANMCQLMAYAWDDFLPSNGDQNIAASLADIDSSTIFPRPLGSISDKCDSNNPLVRHTDSVESRRRSDFKDWVDELGLDAVVFPCNGDVCKADADVNETSAAEAWRNGVLYSNGNCVICQLGISAISVPMVVMADVGVPVNLTFASKAYDDSSLFRYEYSFEKASRLRKAPGRTPQDGDGRRPIRISSTVGEANALRMYVGGEELKEVKLAGGHWEVAVATGKNLNEGSSGRVVFV